MKNIFSKTKSYIVAHKILSGCIFIVLIFLGRFLYGKITSTGGIPRYITSKVERGTIVASVTATGQVSAEGQIDLKPKNSGAIVYVGAKNGDRVTAGKLIAEIDARDANRAVRTAEQNLESAQITLSKLKIENSEENLTADQKKIYADAFNAISNAFLNMPTVLSGVNDLMIQGNLSNNAAANVGKTALAYHDKAENDYYAADKSFQKSKRDYALLNANSPSSSTENMLKETANTAALIADTVKSTLDFANYMADQTDNASAYSTAQSTLGTYTNTMASTITSLSSAQSNISNNKDTSQNVSLDLQSAELSVTEKRDALHAARDNLSDYFVRAPYAGTVANLTILKGDQANSSTIVATLITDNQIAEVSMNEVDVAKIKIGEKATLTFDAIPDLTLTGSVEEIDSIGTVSQGVVTYNVKITFDKEDPRVKPGMSVSAAIITGVKQDVLVVPNSAIKSTGGQNYLESFGAPLPAPADGLLGSLSTTPPNKIPVETGLSNDSQTEIISGVNEGDYIVTRTILPSAATPAAAAPSLFGGGATRTATGGGRAPAGR
jgi:HlyD family secretion protein